MISRTNRELEPNSFNHIQLGTVPPRERLARSNSPSRELVVIPAARINEKLIAAWLRIRNGNPRLKSPYFDYRFTQAVSRVRDDVKIAYTICTGQIDEIFPFQSKKPHQIVPVGGMLNDVNGVISATGRKSSLLPMLMKKMKCRSFPFHSLKNVDAEMERFQFRRINSYHLDLSEGWETYKNWMRKSSSTLARQGQKSRGLARKVGPLRFELDVREPSLLEQMIKLKRSKYQRSHTFDILSVDWAANLLREIHRMQEPGFRGLLSATWAGDKLVALHFGLLSDDILHYWFPVFDIAFARYSPGTQLLMSVAEMASQRGVTKIDLGYGDDPYKLNFSNASESLSCGEMTTGRLAFQIARRKYFWRHRLKSMPLKPLVKSVLRKVFPGFGGWNFR